MLSALVLVFLAIVAAVGVGLIVHFAEKRSLECSVHDDVVTNGQGKPNQQHGQSPAAEQTTPTRLQSSSPEETKTEKPTMTTTPAPPVRNIRLPEAFEPSHYNLKIKPNMYNEDPSTFTFEGSVEISMKSLRSSRNVTLHANSLNITNESVIFTTTPGTNNSPKFVSYTVDKERDFLIIQLDKETTPGVDYTLSMRFFGPLKDDLSGFYYSSYKRGNQTVYLAASQFEATDARKAFPCFDEPAMKATFNVTLVRKRHLVSLSNMPRVNKISRLKKRIQRFPFVYVPNMKATFKVTLVRKHHLQLVSSNIQTANKITISDEFEEDVFKTSVKMSTYLVAFVICDFESKSTTVPNTDIIIQVWSRPEVVEQTMFALQVGAKITAKFIEFSGIKYPLPKQDMIALPDTGAGAMENWGLITFREDYLLFEESVSSEFERDHTVRVIAHELGHQWFGNLVTLEWWDNVWLNEGFASFMEFFGADMLYPEWKMRDQFVVSFMYEVFETDSHVTSHPLSSPVETESAIIFDNIAYLKGHCIVRMAQFILGEDTFERGIHRYLKAHEYSNANSNDIWEAFTQQTAGDNRGIDLTRRMVPWTLLKNYPVVTVVNENGKLVVTQDRFLKNQTAIDAGKYTSAHGYQWNIPFTFVTASAPYFNVTDKDIVWVNKGNQDIPVPSLKPTDWVIANVHQYGFYRVNYDDTNWLALIQQLKTNHGVILDVNRAQILNDAWSVSKAGQLSTMIALQTLEYLDKESDYVPWVAAQRQIDFLGNILRQTELYGKFQDFVVSKLKTAFKHYGMSRENSTYLESRSRSVIVELSCSFGMTECIKKSKTLYEEWMSKPNINPIDPNVRDTVYCTAIAEGDTAHWEFAFKQYQESTATERTRLMNSLACTRSTWLISRLLKMSLTPSVIRKQDFVRLMTSIAKRPVGQLFAWDFIRENWDYLYNDYGKGAISFSRLIPGVTISFSRKFHLMQLQSLLAQNPKLQSSRIDQAVEEIKANVHWANTNLDVVSDWLDSQASTSQSRLTDVRLPRHLLPTKYDVTLKPLMYNNAPETFTFEGSVKIYMAAQERGTNVTLHVNKLDILDNSIKFESQGGSSGPVYIAGSMETDKERQFRIFHLDKPLEKGNNYTIEMNFTAPLTNSMAGLYYSEYKNGNNTTYMTTTQFEPTDARAAFPCFDEPQLKAEFNVRLIRKSHLKTLSNMPIDHSVHLEDDFMMDVYVRSQKMPTYLLAFIISDFEPREKKTSRNITYRAWARPDLVNQTLVGLDAGVRIIDHYEEYFGIDFPLPKQDMIAIPDFSSGAMENWGLITYRETSMLFQPGSSSAANRQYVQEVIAHELAHQWFGDLVTMEWWDDLWLNEGFAAFVEYMGVDFISPEFKMFEQFVLDLHAMFRIDSLVTSHPIFVPVKNPDEINEIFDTISYNKGASVIRMMRFFLGEKTFQMGVQTYLKSRQYSNANHNDLWAGLQKQADLEKKRINVKAVMDTWIKQMNYPVVMVTKADSGKIKITQDRFLSNAETEDPEHYVSEFGYKWQIPFTYTTQKDSRFNHTDSDVKWLNTEELEVNDMYPINGWILGNILQYGVYRVNYDISNWRLLVEQLKKDHTAIHVVNRAQIINDAFGLAKANQLPMDTALSTLDYLDAEEDYVPWAVAEEELAYIENMLAETEAYGEYKRMLQSKVEKGYDRFGLNETGTDYLQSFLRNILADGACRSGNEKCTTEAKALFQQYMADPDNNPISPGVRSTVYCTAVREGGEQEWQFVYDQYVTATSPSELSRLRRAMSCTRKVWILNKYLNIALNFTVIRKQDAPYAFTYVAATPVGRCVAWDFIRANFNRILQVYGEGAFALRNIIRGVTAAFNTDFRLQQMRDFQKLHPDMGTGNSAFSQAMEKTKANINWMNKYYSVVKQWLEKSHSDKR